MSTHSQLDLTNCDREPIHIPGSIQSHGCLIATDINASIILRHSSNLPAAFGIDGEINGRPLESLLGPDATHSVRNALATSNDASRPALILGLGLASGRIFDIAVHCFKSTVIVEFEKASDIDEQPLALARTMLSRLRNIDDVDRLIRDSARLVQAVLGYDRVMIYRFTHDGAGQVVSEAKRGDLESFLGQFFPASDIPQQARALYLRNTVRTISDAGGERIPLVPVVDASGEPLDLSYAHLRSVSPIHCEYLRNMGVAASMSISVIVGGELWGLIACHHYSPRVLSTARRVAAELFGDFFSLHLDALKQKRKLDSAARARRSLDHVLQLASHQTDIADVLRDNLADFDEIMSSDGSGLWIDGNWHPRGVAPPASAIPALARFVGSVSEGRIWATHALSQRLAGAADYAADVSGLLAIPLSQRPRDYLFFFRREVIQTLNWAGNPEKSYETGPLGDRLTPRKSFAIWKEAVQKQAEPWSESDREIAEAARGALVEILLRHNEIVADERSRADVRQRMLNEELNHRVKNILAVIKSLVGHPVQEGRDLADYVASLKGRIQALALAHDQIARGGDGGSLRELLEAELTPYRDRASSIGFDGPELWLDGRAFSVMALVLHELSTNAAKYGALSSSAGRLDVTWQLTAEGDCELVWQESRGPKVSPPTREGFGTVLISRSVPYDLGGDSKVDYAAGGVRARFLLPAKHISSIDIRTERRKETRRPGTPQEAPSDLLAGIKILLVEDQMLIAMDLEAMLANKGATHTVTTGSSADALKMLKGFTPDFAVLDINLGVGTSLPVAQELSKRNIPFIFATGYGDQSWIPPELMAAPMIRKPYDGDELIQAISRVLQRR
jgi:light-regulated signal transduction histidine kinase (bacteriophytochrome)/CheY-like chemotaxis protein